MTDHRAIACNLAVPTKTAVKGALAYVLWLNYGGGNDRIPLLVRSRGGRWIRKWEAMHRLENFRLKSIPPEHPRYHDLALPEGWDVPEEILEEEVRDLLAAMIRERDAHARLSPGDRL